MNPIEQLHPNAQYPLGYPLRHSGENPKPFRDERAPHRANVNSQ